MILLNYNLLLINLASKYRHRAGVDRWGKVCWELGFQYRNLVRHTSIHSTGCPGPDIGVQLLAHLVHRGR